MLAGEVELQRRLSYAPRHARSFADFCTTEEIEHYSQWFPGKENAVADSLPRDFALDDDELTQMIRRDRSPLVPQSFRITPFAGNDRFAHWRSAAETAQNSALAESTRAKRDGSWRRYECFLSRIGCTLDPFLRRLGRRDRIETFACFAAALREGGLDTGRTKTDRTRALSGTIRATLDGVAQAYRLHKFESPIHDTSGRLERVLALQLKGYADEDPATRQQQALPLEVLDRARRMDANDREVAVGQLIAAAFFFAMRSCEYSEVQGQRMTTVVGIDEVRFWVKNEQVRTDDLAQLRRADAVSVTF